MRFSVAHSTSTTLANEADEPADDAATDEPAPDLIEEAGAEEEEAAEPAADSIEEVSAEEEEAAEPAADSIEEVAAEEEEDVEPADSTEAAEEEGGGEVGVIEGEGENNDAAQEPEEQEEENLEQDAEQEEPEQDAEQGAEQDAEQDAVWTEYEDDDGQVRLCSSYALHMLFLCSSYALSRPSHSIHSLLIASLCMSGTEILLQQPDGRKHIRNTR
jgi:hypothetical protein